MKTGVPNAELVVKSLTHSPLKKAGVSTFLKITPVPFLISALTSVEPKTSPSTPYGVVNNYKKPTGRNNMECNKCTQSSADPIAHYSFTTTHCRRNKKNVQTTTAFICKAYDAPLQTTAVDRRIKGKVKK